MTDGLAFALPFGFGAFGAFVFGLDMVFDLTVSVS
jgi:hypothetical protein